MGRNISIDLVKVIAMFMVMTMHSGFVTKSDYILAAGIYISGIAIPLFFMVSGWLLIFKAGGWGYSIRKIGGIIRFVLILSVGYFVLESIVRGVWDWKAFLSAVLNPYLVKGAFGQFWYLGAMIILYGCFPLIKKIYSNYGLNGLVGTLVILYAIESFVFPMNILYRFEEIYVVQTFRVWNWLFYFFIGGILRLKYSQGIKIGCVWVAALAVLYILFRWTMSNIAGEYFFASSLCALYSVVVFLWIVNMKINERFEKIIRFFSQLFLPVYALHMLVIYFLIPILPEMPPVIVCIEIWFLTILISWIVMNIPSVNKIFRL